MLLLAVMLCHGSSPSSETSPVLSLSLSISTCKKELTASCYPMKSLRLQTNSVMSLSYILRPNTSLKIANTYLTPNWRHIKRSLNQLGSEEQKSENDSGSPTVRKEPVLLLLLTSAADAKCYRAWSCLTLAITLRTHTEERKIMKILCKFMSLTKAVFSLWLVSLIWFFFFLPRFYSSYLLLGLSHCDCWDTKEREKKKKGKQRGLVSEVQAVLFPLHGPVLKVFHCQGYKQLFTGISGWEYSISSQWHYFVCLGMQAL